METPFEVTRIIDRKFVYDVFYKKTETNNVVVDAISRFIIDPNYECLRRKYVPDLDKITQSLVLLILYPDDTTEKFGGLYHKPRDRPCILISINTGPLKDFISIFSFVGPILVHEMLHELYEQNEDIEEKLSEFDKQFNKQFHKDKKEFIEKTA